jgi:hypothetical protein
MKTRVWGLTGAAVLAAMTVVAAQNPPASPEGKAQAQVGGGVKDGKWLEITYSRPILRGRTNIFGSGAKYGETLNAGAPVWRAGANVSTRLRTEAALTIGGKPVPAGEYSIFIDLKEGNWTFILSSWPAQLKYDKANTAALWGSYGYTPDKDVTRAPMKLMKSTVSVEQLTWGFINLTAKGGELAIWWDKEFATVPFQVQ